MEAEVRSITAPLLHRQPELTLTTLGWKYTADQRSTSTSIMSRTSLPTLSVRRLYVYQIQNVAATLTLDTGLAYWSPVCCLCSTLTPRCYLCTCPLSPHSRALTMHVTKYRYLTTDYYESMPKP